MINKLILFQQNIVDLQNASTVIFLSMVDNNQIKYPTIISDKCNLYFEQNIPVVHTYYIRHPSLYNKFILTDLTDYKYLKSVVNHLDFNCIILHSELQRLNGDVDKNIDDTNLVKFININNNSEPLNITIERIINDKT